jgi:hypothetical protein
MSILFFLLLTIKAEKPPCDSYECNAEDPTHWGLLYAHVAIPSKFYECTPYGLELFDCPDGLVFPLCAERCDFSDSTITSSATTTTTPLTTTHIPTTQESTTPETTPTTTTPTTTTPTPTPTTTTPTTTTPTTTTPTTTTPTTTTPTTTPSTTTPTTTTPTTTTPTTTTQEPSDWIIIQRRGSPLEVGETRQDFYLPWVNYTNGFGDPRKDFWLGLERIADLTENENYELEILMTTIQGVTHKVGYDTFKVSSSSDNYRLSISGFHGNIWDAMAYHNGQMFSTKDRDNDNGGFDCAIDTNGAWWFNACHYAHLNGVYVIDFPTRSRSIRWYDSNLAEDMFMKFAEMKMRPRI